MMARSVQRDLLFAVPRHRNLGGAADSRVLAAPGASARSPCGRSPDGGGSGGTDDGLHRGERAHGLPGERLARGQRNLRRQARARGRDRGLGHRHVRGRPRGEHAGRHCREESGAESPAFAPAPVPRSPLPSPQLNEAGNWECPADPLEVVSSRSGAQGGLCASPSVSSLSPLSPCKEVAVGWLLRFALLRRKGAHRAANRSL